ncbi:MAG: hypothetical protein RH948_17315 [Cyclobacteriaceae bacterium]
MKRFEKPLKNFETKELHGLSFGRLEGEKDDKLDDSFFPTNSIVKLFQGKFNYVLSPKGGGKSAVFRALKDNLIRLPKNFFDYEKYSIVGVNQAFGFDSNYLQLDKFKETTNRKSYTMAWAVYILGELIKDIKKNYSDKPNYSEFLMKIKKIGDFKEQFQLYNIFDFINKLSVGLSFNVGGQPIEVTPKIKWAAKKEPLILNEIFSTVNDYYKSNNLTALILIDRLDNFVRKESYHIQKNYIQGLIDCIEELSTLSNISPLLFIRTDLFYAFDIDFEYDKLKERVQELNWQDGETLNFIIYRLLANKYIQENYSEYFRYIINEGFKGGHRHHFEKERSVWRKLMFWKKDNSGRLDLKRTIDYTIAEKYIRLFFPEFIDEGVAGKKEFCNWIFDNLEDANNFVNPRLLIYFFNELIKAQIDCNNRLRMNAPKEIVVLAQPSYYHFGIFSQEIFPEVYKRVQNDELRNIHKILKDKEFQTVFKDINERTIKRNTFSFGDVNIKKLNIEKDKYERLLKYLNLLGYIKEVDKQTYQVPKLFQFRMTLQTMD